MDEERPRKEIKENPHILRLQPQIVILYGRRTGARSSDQRQTTPTRKTSDRFRSKSGGADGKGPREAIFLL